MVMSEMNEPHLLGLNLTQILYVVVTLYNQNRFIRFIGNFVTVKLFNLPL